MKSKAQIARKLYSKSLRDLTVGEKSAVSRKFNAQTAEVTATSTPSTSGKVKINFKRPGIAKNNYVNISKTASLNEALNVASINIIEDKEGLIDSNGNTAKFSDTVKANEVYTIAPGVNSAF